MINKKPKGDAGLTSTGMIVVCALVSVAAVIVLLAVLGKF